MEKLLNKAFKKASSLPEEEKKTFAAFIIEELEQEEKWDKLFKNSGKELSILANEALGRERLLKFI